MLKTIFGAKLRKSGGNAKKKMIFLFGDGMGRMGGMGGMGGMGRTGFMGDMGFMGWMGT